MIARQRPTRFIVLVYRMPPTPTAGRVAVWRLLKKIGAIYLQQSVCIFPDNSRLRHELEAVLKRIQESSGEYHLLPLRRLSPDEDAKLAEHFLEQTNKHYDEIIENCEVNFTKEVEFETFRRNFTYEEAEEIRIEFEKIVSWFDRVRDRDWFSSEKEADARSWIERCETMLEGFEANVYRVQETDDSGGHRPAKGPGKPRRTAPRRAAARNLAKIEDPLAAASRSAKTLGAVATVKTGSA